MMDDESRDGVFFDDDDRHRNRLYVQTILDAQNMEQKLRGLSNKMKRRIKIHELCVRDLKVITKGRKAYIQ